MFNTAQRLSYSFDQLILNSSSFSISASAIGVLSSISPLILDFGRLSSSLISTHTHSSPSFSASAFFPCLPLILERSGFGLSSSILSAAYSSSFSISSSSTHSFSLASPYSLIFFCSRCAIFPLLLPSFCSSHIVSLILSSSAISFSSLSSPFSELYYAAATLPRFIICSQFSELSLFNFRCASIFSQLSSLLPFHSAFAAFASLCAVRYPFSCASSLYFLVPPALNSAFAFGHHVILAAPSPHHNFYMLSSSFASLFQLADSFSFPTASRIAANFYMLSSYALSSLISAYSLPTLFVSSFAPSLSNFYMSVASLFACCDTLFSFSASSFPALSSLISSATHYNFYMLASLFPSCYNFPASFSLLYSALSANTHYNFYMTLFSAYLLLPLYATISFYVLSFDVIHSFGYHSFGYKSDAIPGRVNSVAALSLFVPGFFSSYCYELCGASHTSMLSSAIVLS